LIQDPAGSEYWGGKGLTGDEKFRRGTLKVVDGGLLVVNGGEGLVDEMRGFLVKSRARSVRSKVSCSGGEKRLETRVASVRFGLGRSWRSLCERKQSRAPGDAHGREERVETKIRRWGLTGSPEWSSPDGGTVRFR
jgi:hypothetical protein